MFYHIFDKSQHFFFNDLFSGHNQKSFQSSVNFDQKEDKSVLLASRGQKTDFKNRAASSVKPSKWPP
jgi:hypothetical protein